ncbi:HAD family phosphatase [Kineosporia sp. NBRC 101731]|uniref:HAD family hydrolase n=1 Tax=Kineosporia sp. NBRC 101731 TaxID=3032199 RepID=UPI0024A443BA|nr:HAD family phosphatase [Kineosporia sp. NBRC 101731]GLY30420.1 haloacid dehalogenase [Kineosporia sp. NBRC 101731]
MQQNLLHQAVLFDCDGVLVDSEQITNGVLRLMLNELGWPIGATECFERFVGRSLKDEFGVIEQHTGVKVGLEWLGEFRRRRDVSLAESLEEIPGAGAAARALSAAFGGRVACASGADRAKVEMQLKRVGLLDVFAGKVFSGEEMPRSKPAPDVYLAAATALGVDPARTAVIEDTISGTTAGVAAGATVYGYCPPDSPAHSRPEHLLGAGAAHIFTSMDELPGLLGPAGTMPG